jgi:hypothetical protein
VKGTMPMPQALLEGVKAAPPLQERALMGALSERPCR